MEAFDDSDEMKKKLSTLRKSLSLIDCSLFHRLAYRLIPSLKLRSYQLREEVSVLKRRLQLIEQRTGDEACLSCGSRVLTPFDGDCHLEFGEDNFLYVGSKRTGFHHPGCGGEIIAEGADMRFILVSTKKIYSPNGYEIG